MTITISVRKHFTLEELADVIYSMAEGSNYWCKYSGDLGYESTVKNMLENGVAVKLENFEEEGTKYELTLPKIKKGLTIMAKKFPKRFSEIVSGDTDADTADVLLQCSLLGDVIYG